MNSRDLFKQMILLLERNTLLAFGTHFRSMSEIDGSAGRLAEEIENFNPDCVVGILNSGEYIGRKLAQLLKKDYQNLDVSRNNQYFMGMRLNDMLGVNKLLSVARGYEVIVKSRFQNKRYDKVLLADEECGSGRTFQLSRQEVERTGVNEIKECTITKCIGPHTPDYYETDEKSLNRFINRDSRFPWVPYSPHYKKYKKSLEELKTVT